MALNRIGNKKTYIKKFRLLMDLAIERTKEINIEEYNRFLPLMEQAKADIGKILFSFLNMFITLQTVESLLPDARYNFKYDKVIHLLYDFTYFVYQKKDGGYILLSIEEQNKRARDCYHFDFSMRKPGTLVDNNT